MASDSEPQSLYSDEEECDSYAVDDERWDEPYEAELLYPALATGLDVISLPKEPGLGSPLIGREADRVRLEKLDAYVKKYTHAAQSKTC